MYALSNLAFTCGGHSPLPDSTSGNKWLTIKWVRKSLIPNGRFKLVRRRFRTAPDNQRFGLALGYQGVGLPLCNQCITEINSAYWKCRETSKFRFQVGGILYTWNPSYGKRGHRTDCKAGYLVSSHPGVDFGSTLGKANLGVND